MNIKKTVESLALFASVSLKKILNLLEKHPIIFVALYIATVSNISFWLRFQSINESGILFSVSMLLLVLLLTFIILCIVFFRLTFKPVAIFLLITSSVTSYFMYRYGVVFDTFMMFNLFETDVSEASELITSGLFWYILLYGVIPSVLLFKAKLEYKFIIKQFIYNASYTGISLAAIVLNVLLFSSSYASFFKNHHDDRYMINPINYIYSFSKYMGNTVLQENKEPVQIGLDAIREKDTHSEKKPSLLVVVVGETARANNFSLNGYKKATNPKLQEDNVNYYPNFYSCGTSTHISLPCMFSMFRREDFSESQATYYEKLPDVLQHAGMNVIWIDNNSGCKGVCKNIPTVHTHQYHFKTGCSTKECFDEVMLEILSYNMKNKSGDLVVFLHQKGSHGPAYFSRHPKGFKVFLPECESSELQSCSKEEIVNAYDNTILYTDYFLDKVIKFLKMKTNVYNTAMLYASDHGESLGEHNLYLHSLPYSIAPDEQKHVPLITWFSPGFLKQHRLDKTCLKNNTNNEYSHDNLFHSLLGLTQVKTSLYQEELDIFSCCNTNNSTG